MFFQYGDREIAHLKQRDKRLGEAIDIIGPLRRETHEDLFAAMVHSIVGQQISTAAQQTVWKRMSEGLGGVDALSVQQATVEQLQAYGITFKKAEYIKEVANKVHCGQLDLAGLYGKSDAEVVAALSALKGVGVWTAEMMLTFCMQRPDVVSFGDLAILRGMRMLYHHRKIDRKLFDKYRRRYSPYGTVASLYLWAIAGGAIPGMRDYAPRKKRQSHDGESKGGKG